MYVNKAAIFQPDPFIFLSMIWDVDLAIVTLATQASFPCCQPDCKFWSDVKLSATNGPYNILYTYLNKYLQNTSNKHVKIMFNLQLQFVFHNLVIIHTSLNNLNYSMQAKNTGIQWDDQRYQLHSTLDRSLTAIDDYRDRHRLKSELTM